MNRISLIGLLPLQKSIIAKNPWMSLREVLSKWTLFCNYYHLWQITIDLERKLRPNLVYQAKIQLQKKYLQCSWFSSKSLQKCSDQQRYPSMIKLYQRYCINRIQNTTLFLLIFMNITWHQIHKFMNLKSFNHLKFSAFTYLINLFRAVQSWVNS